MRDKIQLIVILIIIFIGLCLTGNAVFYSNLRIVYKIAILFILIVQAAELVRLFLDNV